MSSSPTATHIVKVLDQEALVTGQLLTLQENVNLCCTFLGYLNGSAVL